jgi:hypothetical protein
MDYPAYAMNVKEEILLEEYKLMRTDLLQTRSELQKTIVYSTALASVASALLGKFIEEDNSEYIQVGLALGAIIFLMLGLNYVAHMRHYLAVVRYCEKIAYEYQCITKNPQALGWELFNRKVYASPISTLILWFTQGTQALIPVAFALLCYYFYEVGFDDFTKYSDKIPVIALIIGIVWLLALATGIRELGSDIKVAKERYKTKQDTSEESTADTKDPLP